MRGWRVLASALLAACGGESTNSAAPGGPAKDADRYVPTNPNVSPEGDGALAGGSFEGSVGFGFDTCNSWRPGSVVSDAAQSPSHGERFLTFDSADPCPRCAEAKGDYHIVLGVDPPVPAGREASLYFDVLNLAPAPPTGVLVFGVVGFAEDSLCEVAEVLASVPLAELDASAVWQTRCVTFTPQAPPRDGLDILGFYVADGVFKVGIDALRFGPPCKAELSSRR